jgi:hypothetical protein
MSQLSHDEQIKSRLRILRWSAWIDLALLLALVSSALTNHRDFVHVLGPLHGINFLLLVAIAATAALDGLWSWWFPLAIFLTGGAPGALIGEKIIKAKINVQSAYHNDETTLSARKIEAEATTSGSDRVNSLNEQEERA